jgi:hypothetical protein
LGRAIQNPIITYRCQADVGWQCKERN